jgi:hypothetical protein
VIIGSGGSPVLHRGATPPKLCEIIEKRLESVTTFMGAIMGAIFGKNLPKKGKKLPKTSMTQNDKP